MSKISKLLFTTIRRKNIFSSFFRKPIQNDKIICKLILKWFNNETNNLSGLLGFKLTEKKV